MEAVCKHIRVVAQKERKCACLEGSLDEGRKNGMERSGGTENDKSDHLKILKLFWNPYWSQMYHELLGYIRGEIEEKLVEETILLLARLNA